MKKLESLNNKICLIFTLALHVDNIILILSHFDCTEFLFSVILFLMLKNMNLLM